MKTFTITVPGRPISLNAERSAHWRVRHQQTLRWRTDAYHLALLQRPLEQFENPVIVTAAHYQAKGVMADTANIVPSVKALIDGLRDAGVLKDDAGAQVAGILFLAPQRGSDRVELTLNEVPGVQQKEGKQ